MFLSAEKEKLLDDIPFFPEEIGPQHVVPIKSVRKF